MNQNYYMRKTRKQYSLKKYWFHDLEFYDTKFRKALSHRQNYFSQITKAKELINSKILILLSLYF